ncbi:MAG: hypothetical protein LBR94_04320 [Desulfovibrio sp.]|jgi:hypothetical protein|nr:hypothetical protein [Desulfovibrio sp.]
MPAVRAAMNRAAGEYEPGRKMLVEAINRTARREGIALTSGGGKAITDAQLDKALQHGDRGHEPSLAFILCLCLATGDFTPLEPVWKVFGLVLVSPADAHFLEYGKACDALRKAKGRKSKLEAGL